MWGVPQPRILKASSAHANNPSPTGSHSRKAEGRLSSASPTLLELNGGNAQGEKFWDGDPSKQSFIQFVGLSSPSHRPASRTRITPRGRPASAPSRQSWAKVSTTAGYISPRQIRTANSGDHEEGGTNHHNHIHSFPNSSDDDVGRQCYLSSQDDTDTIDQRRREGIEEGTVRVLERRLEVLARENARLRDATVDSKKEAYATRLDRMALSQRRNLEVMAALQSAKEGADNRTRRIQGRLRAVQVLELWSPWFFVLSDFVSNALYCTQSVQARAGLGEKSCFR